MMDAFFSRARMGTILLPTLVGVGCTIEGLPPDREPGSLNGGAAGADTNAEFGGAAGRSDESGGASTGGETDVHRPGNEGGAEATGGSAEAGQAAVGGRETQTGGSAQTGGMGQSGSDTGGQGAFGTGGSAAEGGALEAGGATTTGGWTSAGSGGRASGGASRGGASSTGGAATGGTGGPDSGGAATGGRSAGGTGGTATGGRSTGGSAGTGGAATGGRSTGGAPSGGSGGASSGGTGGTPTGGASATGGGSSVDCSGTMPTGGTDFCSVSTNGTAAGLEWYIWASIPNGDSCITVYDTPAFSARWNEPGNLLLRFGQDWGNAGKPYDQYASITAEFAFEKTGNGDGYSYIGVYGWSKNPCVEYYIVEDSFGGLPFDPYGATPKGSATIDGETYELFEKTVTLAGGSRCNVSTWSQFWSVRHKGRQCGTIPVKQHFDAWNGVGMLLGTLLETSILVEVGGGLGSIEFSTANVTAH
jgi:hypothetical protein